MPWWRGRSWSTDLDTLTRLHKGLLALDVDPDAQHKPVPAPELPIPSAGPPAPQEPLVPPQAVQAEQQTLPERLAPESESAQTMPLEAGRGEQGPDQKDARPWPAGAGSDPGIAARPRPFRY